jgi:hypothetical protein
MKKEFRGSPHNSLCSCSVFAQEIMLPGKNASADKQYSRQTIKQSFSFV